MKPLALALCFGLLANATATLLAEPSELAFNLRLVGVKFDYPGAEQWAEIERPDGKRIWAFAIYTGQDHWTVPVPATLAGKYKLLRVEKRAGDIKSEVSIASSSELSLEVKKPRKFPPPASPQKPLVEAGAFVTFFAAEEPWCVNDHTFVQGPDKTWHLFGITHPKPLDFAKDPGRRLCHATAQMLGQKPWQAQPPAVTRDWEKYREYLLWAPYVLRHEGTYYMFVCVGDQDTHRYRIHLLTSPDLKEWTRHPANPMVVDGFDGRDPFVLRVGDQWLLYYTATTTPEGGNHCVACVRSKDLVHWSDRQLAFIHPRAGTFGGPTESPFIVQRGGGFYLFVCDNEWTEVYVSRDPFHWDYEQENTRLRAHAAEIVRDRNGQWFISHAGWTGGPLQLAPLKWNDGFDRESSNILPAAK